MTIEVGQQLDKYELLERVGQGGMAVVYRALDRALDREVAVKVLHHHLADSREARERFEREARAVAKLHHANILEIYDFSGAESPESYIVAEFIRGTTLRDFVAEHAIHYPEVGAMIAVQVCRALSHAHSLGILHRDIKPENIMIRDDGVVKLTDFGIAQMVDVQRMTVTGQLLGSPAYMSPEHVEGKRLDFRTDVFSAGILLYQLITGELPFQGRNPHEVLKRIADGRYRDPRLKNSLVGDRLARILARALAREPDDRYADVTLMLGDLERYLGESGLADFPGELARFFAAPAAYEMALRPRLAFALTRRGHELLDTDQVAALEAFNRVLTLEPDNAEVLGAIERLSRRRRGTRAAFLFAAAVAAAGAVAAVPLLRGSNDASTGEVAGTEIGLAALLEPLVGDDFDGLGARGDPVNGAGAPEPDGSGARGTAAGPSADAGPPEGESGGAPASGHGGASEPRPAEGGESEEERGEAEDEGPSSERDPEGGEAERAAADAPDAGAPPADRGDGIAGEPDAAIDAGGGDREVPLTIYPPGSEYRVGDGPWQRAGDGSATLEIPAAGEPVVVEGRNEGCCDSAREVIRPGDDVGAVELDLTYRPAHITPKCDVPNVRVLFDDEPRPFDRATSVVLADTTHGRKTVEVAFVTEDSSAIDRQEVRVSATEKREVECEL